jgi:hypothetical protein
MAGKGVMTFAELLAAPSPQRGPKCGVALLLRTMPDADRVILEQALATDPDLLGHANIWRALAGSGYDIKQGTIAYHRNGRCRCTR